MSSVADLPQGGVQPVVITKGFGLCWGESLNQCFSLNLLLKSSVSLCTRFLSPFKGRGQTESPLLSNIFSSSERW